MRIPLSWLKEYIDLSLSPDEIAQALTLAGLEVEHFETIGDHLKPVKVVEILESVKHPNADKLSIAKVTDGMSTYTIVCGASNCRTGIKAALAPLGTTLIEDGESYTIKKAKIRGIESEGMLCAERELGLTTSHFEGILELPSNIPTGSSLYDIYADTYFDISLTPNLGHCMSIFGVARELSAILNIPLRTSSIDMQECPEKIESVIKVSVADFEECPQYACRLIRNVTVGPSPAWLQQKLEKCGIRPLNNVVDVTNYLLIEMGHPLHAFDFNKLLHKHIVVRKAQKGESLLTLDEKERVLSEKHIVICDENTPIALAGIMGGLKSAVDYSTTDILLEAAQFNPISIRKGSKQLCLSTDASKRFEKGTDPNILPLVLNRAAALIQEIAGGDIVSGILVVRKEEPLSNPITVRLGRVNQVIGRTFSPGEVEDVFRRLQFPFKWDGQGSFDVFVPAYRCDISIEIDLIEEIARLYGFENIPRVCSGYVASTLPHSVTYLFEQKISKLLLKEGLQEFLTCDLIGPSLLKIAYGTEEIQSDMVKVLNPTSSEQSVLRTSLLPGLLHVVKLNFDHQNHHVAGFEIGQIHIQCQEQYQEQSALGIILSGHREKIHWKSSDENHDFFDLKGITENLLSSLNIETAQYKNLHLSTFHPGRQASIFVDSHEVGSIGEIHPSILRRLDIKERLLFAEFNLQLLMQCVKEDPKISPLSLYPCSERDWTFTLDKSIPYEYIAKSIAQHRSPLLESFSLKSLYCSEKLPPGTHNITLHFIYRDNSKTIEQEVVDQEHAVLTQKVLKNIVT